MTSRHMSPQASVITLGVDDLERSLAFYRDGLGWPSAGLVGTEFVGDETHPSGAAAMFELANGVLLMLYPRTELAKDAGVPLGEASATEFSLGYLVRSRDDVDALLAQARAGGATVIGEPRDRPWGIYSGYFADLDGHLWEVIWNPQFPS